MLKCSPKIFLASQDFLIIITIADYPNINEDITSEILQPITDFASLNLRDSMMKLGVSLFN